MVAAGVAVAPTNKTWPHRERSLWHTLSMIFQWQQIVELVCSDASETNAGTVQKVATNLLNQGALTYLLFRRWQLTY